MKTLLSLSVALALATGATLYAEELKSGLQPGAAIGPFDVVKCAGPDDGVKVGTELCYRCKYGSRPMVMVFARKTDGAVVDLAKQLDKAVGENEAKQFKAFVNVLGENREELEKVAKDVSAKSKLANVPLVVPVEFDNGPGDYGINPKAEVTVIVAKGGKVTANHSFAKGELNEKGIAAVLANVPKLLAE